MNDDELDPAQDARVRALLADLSGSGDTALPPEVAARLDDTLAGLVAEQQADRVSEERPATGTVVPLRPRWMPRAAAAAAAVIVIGAGGVAAANLGVFHGGGGMSGSSESSAGGGATSSRSDAQAPPSAATSSGSASGGKAYAAEKLPDLRAASFAADVRRLLVTTKGAKPHLELRAPAPTPGSADQAAPACRGPRYFAEEARQITVTYDGKLAALVVHPAQGGHRLVEAWTCSGGRRLASTTIAP